MAAGASGDGEEEMAADALVAAVDVLVAAVDALVAAVDALVVVDIVTKGLPAKSLVRLLFT